jgi:hypothetical protein
MSPNGVRSPDAATLPKPLVEFSDFSRLVIATLLSRVLKTGLAYASVCRAKTLKRIWLNMALMES